MVCYFHKKCEKVFQKRFDFDLCSWKNVCIRFYPRCLNVKYDTTAPEIEPEWVQDEREQFSLHKDTDKDGYLSFQEVSICF